MGWSSSARRGLVIATALVAMFALGVSSTGAGAGAARSAARRAPLVAKGNRVLLVGDSLLWQSIDPVRAALQADGWEPTVTAAPATTVGSWTSRMKTLIAENRPDVIVIELGTNNCVNPCRHLDAVIARMMRDIPRTIPVYWLNVQTQPDYPTDPERVNAALDTARSRWSNITLVDMNARFRDHPEWHVPDGLHFSPAGSEQFATLIAQALRASR